MSDPIKDLGQAAEAYIAAAGSDGAKAGEAFEAVIEAYGGALKSGALGEEQKVALEGERHEWKEDSAQFTQIGWAYWAFEQHLEERDFADMAAYIAAGAEQMSAQPLRVATPIPVPNDESHFKHAIIDTGRYTLRVDADEIVRAFDKATGEERLLLATSDEAFQLEHHGADEMGPPTIHLADGTFVIFAEQEVGIVKYNAREGEYGDIVSFPIDRAAPAGEEVKVDEPVIRPIDAAGAYLPGDGKP